MKTGRTLLLSAITLLSMDLCAQTAEKPLTQQDKITQQRLVEGLERGNNKRTQMRAVETQDSQALQVQTSKYNNKEKEILSRLNVEIIPADFPEYKTEYTDEKYNALMQKWYSGNPSLLKNQNDK